MGSCCSTPAEEEGQVRPTETSPLLRQPQGQGVVGSGAGSIQADGAVRPGQTTAASQAKEHYRKVIEKASSNLIDVQSLDVPRVPVQDQAERAQQYLESASKLGARPPLFGIPSLSKQYRAPVSERLGAPGLTREELAAFTVSVRELSATARAMAIKPVGALVVTMPASS